MNRNAAQDAGTPAVPRKVSSNDNAFKDLKDMPQFMLDLITDMKELCRPKTKVADIQSNLGSKVSTLESTPNGIAVKLKAEGVDLFESERYSEARGLFTQAIDANPTFPALLQSCYLNRAACSLKLGFWHETIKDTAVVLTLNPKSEKAYWRAAQALVEIGKARQAVDCCDRGLEVNPDSKDFPGLESLITRSCTQEKKRRKKEIELALQRAYQVRGLKVRNSSEPPIGTLRPRFHGQEEWFPLGILDHEDEIPLIGPKASTWKAPDPNTLLAFPLLLRYEEHDTRDSVAEFPEHHPIEALFDEIFSGSELNLPRRPWDVNGDYYIRKLIIYAKTHKKRIHKFDRKMTLREIIDQCAKREMGAEEGTERHGLVLDKEGLGLFVFVKGSAAERDWIARVKGEAAAT